MGTFWRLSWRVQTCLAVGPARPRSSVLGNKGNVRDQPEAHGRHCGESRSQHRPLPGCVGGGCVGGDSVGGGGGFVGSDVGGGSVGGGGFVCARVGVAKDETATISTRIVATRSGRIVPRVMAKLNSVTVLGVEHGQERCQ